MTLNPGKKIWPYGQFFIGGFMFNKQQATLHVGRTTQTYNAQTVNHLYFHCLS